MNALTRKIGPLPVWAWVGIAALGIAAGVYLRRRMASASSASSNTIPADTSSTTTAGSPGSSFPDFGAATAGGGMGSGIAPSPSGVDPAQYVQDVLAAFQSGGANALSAYGSGFQTAESFFGSPGGGFSTPADSSIPSPAAPTTGTTVTAPHSTAVHLRKAAAPFGGIASTRTTKTGTKITTYKSGRVVEQAKGKKPYVAKKGRK